MVRPAHQGLPRTISVEVLKWVIIFTTNLPIAYGGETTTRVTTYVVQTQEEREQSRWTLTQWLRIKERMKLMDVWLAMFSDPSKDKFRPELNISILGARSNMQRKVDGILTHVGTGQGNTIKGQLWLTNLFSSKIGIRTLNLDLGLEAGNRDSGSLSPAINSNNTSSALAATASSSPDPSAVTNWYALNLRLFGKHIQDSSLVIKYGFMQTKNSLYLPNTPGVIDRNTNAAISSAVGTIQGAELQIYLTNTLGIEATGHQYTATTVAYADHKLEGTYGDALLFIEIGFLRLQGGIYEERWYGGWSNTKTSTKESGYVGGIKLML